MGFGTSHSSRPIDVLHRLGAIQLDSVNTLARSHELVPFARLGVNSLAEMHQAIYREKQGFEYWGHAASWLPMSEYRYFIPRRARLGERWCQVKAQHGELCAEVLERIRQEGPLRTSQFEDPHSRRGSWWSWKPAKLALEYLFAVGELMCSDRLAGFERQYDLTERVLPPGVDVTDPGDVEAARYLSRRAIGALGIATAGDVVDYYRLMVKDWRKAIATLLEAGEVVEVSVENWDEPAYAQPSALAGSLDLPEHAPTYLTPFDNLVWNRDRTERLFGFRYLLELYVPADKRVHGYYVVPLLARGQLGGRADLKFDRSNRVLRVRTLRLEGAEPVDAIVAAERLAAHLGADSITVERVEPAELSDEVERVLRGLGPSP
jgi:uncharacterized protein YcaQ